MRYLEPPPPPTRLSGPPVRGRVLVFSPHPDDETIGIGGTLLQHVEGGDPVHVIFLTAGTSGDPTGAADPGEYAALREREARAAGESLGLGELEFWGFPDNFRVNENDLGMIVPKVKEAIERIRPDVIYAPHKDEQHSDHHTTAVAVARALASMSRPPAAYGFEVWSPSLAAFVVDMSPQYERKIEALRCYPSQLEHTAIERFITGLNAYRAVFLEAGARFGEAFVPILPDADAGLPPAAG